MHGAAAIINAVASVTRSATVRDATNRARKNWNLADTTLCGEQCPPICRLCHPEKLTEDLINLEGDDPEAGYNRYHILDRNYF